MNINSIRNKLEDLEYLIDQILNTNGKIIHFIAQTETKINESDVPYYNMNNYTVFHCTRSDGYGGCALFVRTCSLIEKKIKIEPSLNITVVYEQPVVNGDTFI